MFDDEDYYGDYDDEMEKSVEKYEAMLKGNDSVYFDSEEFEYIIDHYTKNNELKRSRQAVELAMSQHPESNKLKIKYARQYLLEKSRQGKSAGVPEKRNNRKVYRSKGANHCPAGDLHHL